ncbi:hypothetical protein N9V86_03680 [Opitutales bacterium]|nr:hypothetical protein [Opitutales bacterium]
MVRGTTWCVTDRENEGDNDDRQESEKYPATVADEVILNPRNHDKGNKKWAG